MSFKPGWIIAIIMIWLVTQIVFSICEFTYIGSQQVGIFTSVLSAKVATDQGPIASIISGFAVGWDYFQLLWSMMWWKYAFLSGTWEIVRLFLRAITGGFWMSFVIMLIKR
jgi:hypothetical protein